MARTALPVNAAPECASIDPETFFPQGKRQRDAARAVCEGCPFMQPCEAIAIDMQVLTDNGDIVDGATGVFGGKAYRMGVIID